MARIDWRFVLGFVVAWLMATGALVAAGMAAPAPTGERGAHAIDAATAQARAHSAAPSSFQG